MIKLIASDMDGTLLDDNKQLPFDFFCTVDGLCEMGIKFVIASGRTYAAVAHLFPEEYLTKLDFICDNGAYIVHNGEVVDITPLDRAVFEEFVAVANQIGGFKLLVCAVNGTYNLPCDPEFNKEVAKFYKNHIECDDLLAIKDTIYKLAVCDPLGAQTRGKPELDKVFGDRLNIQVSGPVWMDVMSGGVSKGTALAKLAKILGVDLSEVMAFGDYYNDTDMLQTAGVSCAMANANDYIKSICTNIVGSNNDGGVTKEIQRCIFHEVS